MDYDKKRAQCGLSMLSGHVILTAQEEEKRKVKEYPGRRDDCTGAFQNAIFCCRSHLFLTIGTHSRKLANEQWSIKS